MTAIQCLISDLVAISRDHSKEFISVSEMGYRVKKRCREFEKELKKEEKMNLHDSDKLELVAIWKAACLILIGTALVPVLWFFTRILF